MNIIKMLVNPIILIGKNFSLLKSAVSCDVRQRYAGSVAGASWAVLYPIILFIIYATLYLVIFRVKPTDMTTNTYLVYIMSGLLPFLGFSESLSAGTTSLSNKKALLLNTVYLSEFIPIQAVLAASMTLFIGVILLFLSKFIILQTFSLKLLFVPYVIILQLMFTIGIVWVLSILNLLIKDIQQSLSFITMLLMILSPIAYTPAMVPSALKLIMYLNPFSYYVWSYQDLFVRDILSHNIVIASIISLTVFGLGNYFYSKAKKVFYEFA